MNDLRQLARLPIPALLLVLLALPAAAQVARYQDVAIPALRRFDIPTPQKHVLDSGLVIFLMEDHELPLVNLTARIHTGGRLVPDDKTGLDDVFGEAWRTGGTESRTGDQLDDQLEAMAASVESSMGVDSATLSMNCLKQDFQSVLSVWHDVLRHPSFRDDKIDIAKKQVNTGIARRNDDPFSIVQREAAKLGYGASSPYARVPEYETVAAITRDDLLAWHAAYVHPNRTVIGVSGDFDPAKMLATLKKELGSWAKGPEAADPEAAMAKEAHSGLYLVEKADVTQAQIAMVDVGIRRDNPDYYAVEVMNEILSGSFPSRLFSNIRSKKGLAYAVWGGVYSSYDRPGLTWLGLGTKNETMGAAIEALREEIRGIHGETPVTEAELKRAKDSILNSFIFKVDSRDKVLGQQVTYAYFGYPADFLQHYQAAIEKVTTDDVMRVAKEYLRDDRLAVLVVGKPADFDKPLDSFGPVTKLDITIPEPGGDSAAEVTDESRAKGKQVLARMLEGYGGASAVAAVKSYRIKGQVTMRTPMGEMKMAVTGIYDGMTRFRQDMDMGGQMMAMVATPEDSFMSMMGQAQDLPGSQKDEVMKEAKRSPLFILQQRDSAGLSVSHSGTEKVGDVEADVIDVDHDGVKVRLLVDPATGRVVRSSYHGMGPAGPAETVTDYLDYREAGGIWVAFAEKSTSNGEPSQDVTIEEFTVNPELPADTFTRPGQ